MASDPPDLELPEGGGVEGAAVAAAVAAGAACISCGVAIVGEYCAGCGQKNDDMRRSTFVLFKDFIKDTFSFDSRMWRTLGLLAAAPGTVPAHYSHGRRSRYTPPVRLFLVVSFLFFLTLGVTQTMFIALEVRARTPEEIAEALERKKKALEALATTEAGSSLSSADGTVSTRVQSDEGLVVIDGETVECDIKVTTRFFVRPSDLKTDPQAWQRCAQSVEAAAKVEIEGDADASSEEDKILKQFQRVLGGVSSAVADPQSFNDEVNAWLPRVMFVMTPILALIMALFLRGRDALMFDHLVFSLYAHATAFAIIGAAIVAAQVGASFVLPVAMGLLGIYFFIALRRAYRRGWIKTAFTTVFAGLIYVILLVSIVGGVISGQLWQSA